MRKLLSIVLLAVIPVYLLFGCSNNQFQKTFEEFKTQYISANDFTDNRTGKIDDIIRAIDLDKYEKAINILKDNLKMLADTASSSAEKYHFNTASESLADMEFILYARKNIDHLTEEEERKLWNTISLIDGDRDFFMNGLD
jgi:hypothetical protein